MINYIYLVGSAGCVWNTCICFLICVIAANFSGSVLEHREKNRMAFYKIAMCIRYNVEAKPRYNPLVLSKGSMM